MCQRRVVDRPDPTIELNVESGGGSVVGVVKMLGRSDDDRQPHGGRRTGQWAGVRGHGTAGTDRVRYVGVFDNISVLVYSPT